jgi:peptide/nickel transport system permease protein
VGHQSTGSFISDSAEVAREALPATLSLVVPALVLAAVVGFLAGGALARVRWRRILDLPIYVAVGLSPIFVGLVLTFFGFKWDLTPIGGYCDFFNPTPAPPFEPGAEQCGGAVDWATHLVLPVITLSLYFAAVYTRVVRALVAQVRGGTEPEVRRKRRRRSRLLYARAIGRDFGFAIGVCVFVETVFGIPGLGYSTVTSIYAANLVETQAYILYATFLAIAVQFAVDVVVGALDPGLRWERTVAREPMRT